LGVFSLPSPCRRGDWGEVVTHYEYSGTNYNMTSELHQRHIPFEGCHNFRDVGGYKAINGSMVGWRRLYRSSEIHYMTDADVTHARDSLGVTTVIDLRQPSVAARDGERYLTRPPVRYHNIALIDDGDAASDLEPADPIPMTVDYLQRLDNRNMAGALSTQLRRLPSRTPCQQCSIALLAKTAPDCLPPCCSESLAWPTRISLETTRLRPVTCTGSLITGG
jgi:hypothetical protein